MLLKDCDSREYDVLVLEVLARDAALTSAERQRVLQALAQIRASRARMLDVAAQLDTLLGKRDDWIVLHDLRIDDGADGLEFDHLLINRLLQVWVLESSCFDLELVISPFGDLVTRPASPSVQGSSPASRHTSPFGSEKSHGLSDASSRPREAGISPSLGQVSADNVDASQETLLTPSPLLAIPERAKAFLRWWDASGLLPQKLGVTLQPQLNQRIVMAHEEQISRPPEDIVDSRAVISLSALWEECLQLKGRSAPVSRLRSFTHRIDVRRLRDIGMALAELHHVSRTDWVKRLGLSCPLASADGPLTTNGEAFQWIPVDLGYIEAPGQAEGFGSDAWDGNGAFNDAAVNMRSATSTAATLSVDTFLASLKRSPTDQATSPDVIRDPSQQSCPQGPSFFENNTAIRGLKATDWQHSSTGTSPDVAPIMGRGQQGHEMSPQDMPPQDNATRPHGDPGERTGKVDSGDMQGGSAMKDEMADRMPRCDGCRRWLSKESIARYREARQQSFSGPFLCGRCLKSR